ncbi:Plasma membrane Mg(2+) transporter [Komagataella phaffii CBS 7435]|uniref:Plasma membrane Mg(2+) transporter, expression and turnover are regulated by Mg(2+) concentration n=2 Tax=Komagataella phaffii TaxID=460519 RepID=C4QXF3_KOMPG|nr:Plasma membrane Mg(2+) transporter, expression and turnover are regulated by Mg(2+) concentration [Komagataella phaffii GS115]AOA60351.1 GQ67_02088T0 [Komagataella phaffii]CAH2446739.1 Plasma membrane Mg(2+) transporter [Komagataella phaffii CBS 7435]AOA66368.1 GQ68_02103T0 [Komagataella phaffii GS115]CAY67926.1 Plasma membrane Mg(2+) transporter, expression and turnover are regulated by Mg(2+) concentration [Komagataella phaffii GS115]CCA37005.1 Plasma membrane Mg(2+) transporter [Komagata
MSPINDSSSSRHSLSPVIRHTSSHDSITNSSVMSDNEELHDHRHQSSSLPIRKEGTSPSFKLNDREMPPGGELRLPPPATRTSQNPSQFVESTDLRDRMLYSEDSDNEDIASPYLASFNNSSSKKHKQPGFIRRTRSKSISEQFKSLINTNVQQSTNPGGGILLNRETRPSISGANMNPLAKQPSRTSIKSTGKTSLQQEKKERQNSSSDSDVDSYASRSSKETEEDVCFPMVPENVRVRGIDFMELENFIEEERLEKKSLMKREEALKDFDSNIARGFSSGNSKPSSAALRYIPKNITHTTNADNYVPFPQSYDPGDVYLEEKSNDSSNKKESSTEDDGDNGVTFQNQKRNAEAASILPDRYSFYSSDNNETIHAPDISSLVNEGQKIEELFHGAEATWWLDCICPTDNEMKVLAKAFGIHPLTAEDIRMQERREKVELFKTYYFVCFHSFETDPESEDFLEPINVYIVVFREGILSFHFTPINHPANVRRRVRQLRDYVNVSADWLCYAMIDDITDGFAPVIQATEYEADAIEESVFVARDQEFGIMLQRIGESRRKVMTLMRLLSGKADVIKMFAKRCQDEANSTWASNASIQQTTTPRADIALYLSDISDHIITMFQSLLSYEKIFSRSHSNYLAQLQVESFYSNHKVTEMLSKVTLLGTIFFPMNMITGLFGMNVTVPGQDTGSLNWWFGILGCLLAVVFTFGFLGSYWMNRSLASNTTLTPASGKRSIRSFRYTGGNSTSDRARSILSLPRTFSKYD